MGDLKRSIVRNSSEKIIPLSVPEKTINVQQVLEYFKKIKKKPALEIKFLLMHKFGYLDNPQQFKTQMKKILDDPKLRQIPEWERFRLRFRAKQLDHALDKILLYVDQMKNNWIQGGSEAKYAKKIENLSLKKQQIEKQEQQIEKQDDRSRSDNTQTGEKIRKIFQNITNRVKLANDEQKKEFNKNLLFLQKNKEGLLPEKDTKKLVVPWKDIGFDICRGVINFKFLNFMLTLRNFDFRYKLDKEEFLILVENILKIPLKCNQRWKKYQIFPRFLVIAEVVRLLLEKRKNHPKFVKPLLEKLKTDIQTDFIPENLSPEKIKILRIFEKEFPESYQILKKIINPNETLKSSKEIYKNHLKKITSNYQKRKNDYKESTTDFFNLYFPD